MNNFSTHQIVKAAGKGALLEAQVSKTFKLTEMFQLLFKVIYLNERTDGGDALRSQFRQEGHPTQLEKNGHNIPLDLATGYDSRAGLVARFFFFEPHLD